MKIATLRHQFVPIKMLSVNLHRYLYWLQLFVEYVTPFICLLIIFPVMYRFYGKCMLIVFLVAMALACFGFLYFQHLKRKHVNELVIMKPSVELLGSGIHVLIWKHDLKGTGNVGHVALRLSYTTYISRWPKYYLQPGIAKKKTIRGEYYTMAKDIRDEGKFPDMLIKIPHNLLDTTKVNDWFEELWDRGDTRYNLKVKSCSDMVENALKAGDLILFSEIRRYIRLGFNVPDDFAERLLITLTFQREKLLIKLLYTLKTCCTWHAFSLFAIYSFIFGLQFLGKLSELLQRVLIALKSNF